MFWGDFHLTSKRLEQNKVTGGDCRLLPSRGVAYQLVECRVSFSYRVKVQMGVKLSGQRTQNCIVMVASV